MDGVFNKSIVCDIRSVDVRGAIRPASCEPGLDICLCLASATGQAVGQRSGGCGCGKPEGGEVWKDLIGGLLDSARQIDQEGFADFGARANL